MWTPNISLKIDRNASKRDLTKHIFLVSLSLFLLLYGVESSAGDQPVRELVFPWLLSCQSHLGEPIRFLVSHPVESVPYDVVTSFCKIKLIL